MLTVIMLECRVVYIVMLSVVALSVLYEHWCKCNINNKSKFIFRFAHRLQPGGTYLVSMGPVGKAPMSRSPQSTT